MGLGLRLELPQSKFEMPIESKCGQTHKIASILARDLTTGFANPRNTLTAILVLTDFDGMLVDSPLAN